MIYFVKIDATKVADCTGAKARKSASRNTALRMTSPRTGSTLLRKLEAAKNVPNHRTKRPRTNTVVFT